MLLSQMGVQDGFVIGAPNFESGTDANTQHAICNTQHPQEETPQPPGGNGDPANGRNGR